MKSFLTLVVFLITENGSEEEKKFVHTLRAFQRRAVSKYNFKVKSHEAPLFLPLLEVKTHSEKSLGILKTELEKWAQNQSSIDVLLNRTLLQSEGVNGRLILQTVTGLNPFYETFAPIYYEMFEDERDAREPSVFGLTLLVRSKGEPEISLQQAQEDFNSLDISKLLKISGVSILTSPLSSRDQKWTTYTTVLFPSKGGN